jgi:hypothetical protein
MKVGDALSIWFFTGVSLAVNGLIILVTGLYELASPPEHQVVLGNLHANIWWGAVLLIIGLYFSIRHSPGREGARSAGKS